MNRTNLVLTFRSSKPTTKYFGESSLEQISRASDIIIAESGVFNSTDREQFREYVRQRAIEIRRRKALAIARYLTPSASDGLDFIRWVTGIDYNHIEVEPKPIRKIDNKRLRIMLAEVEYNAGKWVRASVAQGLLNLEKEVKDRPKTKELTERLRYLKQMSVRKGNVLGNKDGTDTWKKLLKESDKESGRRRIKRRKSSGNK